jgi:ABC-2 type transport system permease protein
VRLSGQYRNSFLGWAWSLLQPITQIAVYTIVFATIMRFPQKDYALFVVSGVLPWNFLGASLLSSCQSLMTNSSAVKHSIISRTIFPVAEVMKNFYTLIFALVIMYLFSLIFFTDFKVTILFLPFVLLPLLLTLLALSIALSFITPYVRDINEFVNVFLTTTFFLTPIIYPISIMPEKVQFLFNFNPMYLLIEPIRIVMYEGKIPSYQHLLTAYAVAFGAIIVSYVIYKKLRKNVIYYL